MRDCLVRPDGLAAEDDPFTGILDGALQPVLGVPDCEACRHDPLRVQGTEERGRAAVLLADQILGRDLHVLEVDREFAESLDASSLKLRQGHALGSRVDKEQGEAVGLRPALLLTFLQRGGTGDEKHLVGNVGAGDEHLLAVDTVETLSGILLGQRLDPEAVGAGVGLGEREAQLQAPVRHVGQDPLLELLAHL